MVHKSLVRHETFAAGVADGVAEVLVHVPVQQYEGLEHFLAHVANELTIAGLQIVSV